MSMERKRLGLALCGSYCTYEKLFAALPGLMKRYDLIPIMSDTAAQNTIARKTVNSIRSHLPAGTIHA